MTAHRSAIAGFKRISKETLLPSLGEISEINTQKVCL